MLGVGVMISDEESTRDRLMSANLNPSSILIDTLSPTAYIPIGETKTPHRGRAQPQAAHTYHIPKSNLSGKTRFSNAFAMVQLNQDSDN